MNKDINFKFCIIQNPFSIGGRNIIFLSKSDKKLLNKDVLNSTQYKDVREILKQYGYVETGEFQFESPDNNTSSELPTIDLMIFLEEYGLTYSRELELNIINELDGFKSELSKNNSIESIYKSFDNKFSEPNYVEKITLYFYLFLEFGFNDKGKPVIQFNGDFMDSNNYDDRNYIRIIKSDFKRIKDPKKPTSIILSSVKTQFDFIKESGLLYSGYFRYQKNEKKNNSTIIKENKHVYNLLDIKNYINPNQPIIVETNSYSYNKLIDFSNKLKEEKIIEDNTKLSVEYIIKRANKIKNNLQKKMIKASENDDFETSIIIKKNIDLIDEKIDVVKHMLTKEITTEDYFRIFKFN